MIVLAGRQYFTLKEAAQVLRQYFTPGERIMASGGIIVTKPPHELLRSP